MGGRRSTYNIMGFDPVLGAGNIPRTQPAILNISEDVSKVVPTTISSQLDFTDKVQVAYLIINVSYVSGVNGTTPNIKLFRSGTEIDRLEWNTTIATIATATGQDTLYAVSLQRPDIMDRNDFYKVSVGLAGGAGNTTLHFNINVIGTYL